MELPKGTKPQGTNNALRLRKSQYGLRQSGRTLWIELREGLATTGFRKLESDWGLYYRPSSIATKPMLVLAYANDIVLAASTHGDVRKVHGGLKKRWTMTDLGEIINIFGLKVTREKLMKRMCLTQPAYIDKLRGRFPGHSAFRRSWTAPFGSSMTGAEKQRYHSPSIRRSSAAFNGSSRVRGPTSALPFHCWFGTRRHRPSHTDKWPSESQHIWQPRGRSDSHLTEREHSRRVG